MRDIPVISVDPNGPWRQINGVSCLFTGIHDQEMVADFRDGHIPVGSKVIMYVPYDETSDAVRRVRMTGEYGWGNLARVEQFTIIEKDDHGRPPWVHLYLQHIYEMSVVESS